MEQVPLLAEIVEIGHLTVQVGVDLTEAVGDQVLVLRSFELCQLLLDLRGEPLIIAVQEGEVAALAALIPVFRAADTPRFSS